MNRPERSRPPLRLTVGPPEDFDLQAGGPGLTFADSVSQYLKTPGHLFALLRYSTGETVAAVAKVTSIAASDLEAYEHGTKAPTLPELAALSDHFEADLRQMLEAFGHVGAAAVSEHESYGIAAQSKGELTEVEKVDLRRLVSNFAKTRPRRR